MKLSDLKTGYVKPGIILLMDIAVSVVASLLSILLIRTLTAPIFNFTHYVYIWLALACTGSLIGFLVIGSHKIILRYSTLHNIAMLAVAVVIKDVLLLVCLLANVFSLRDMNVGILLILFDSALSFSFLVLTRISIVTILSSSIDSKMDMDTKVNRMNVLVFGYGDKLAALLSRLEFSPHYNVVGVLTLDKKMAGTVIRDRKVFFCESETDLLNLQTLMGGIAGLLFSRIEDSTGKENTLLKWCMECGMHILVAPKVENIDYQGLSVKAAAEVSMESNFIPDGMGGFQRNLKRIIDFCLSCILIVFFSPLMLICCIAIKLEDHGPAIFKQERIGRFGRPFYIYKFRSMRMDAEKAGPALYSGKDDDRQTKVGKFLREHHLDELPQLFNVFLGQMAFIGYRPERQYYINKIMELDPRYYYLYQIRPGVTSYATLHNGYTDTLEKMVNRLQYDLYYLRNRSILFDMKVLFETFMNIAFGKKF